MTTLPVHPIASDEKNMSSHKSTKYLVESLLSHEYDENQIQNLRTRTQDTITDRMVVKKENAKIMGNWSNRFLDPQNEIVYQKWCQLSYFPTARRFTFAIVCLHLMMVLLDVLWFRNLQNSFDRSYSTKVDLSQWLYLIIAGLLLIAPSGVADSKQATGARTKIGALVKEEWKWCFVSLTLLFGGGFMSRVGQTSRIAQNKYLLDLAHIFKDKAKSVESCASGMQEIISAQVNDWLQELSGALVVSTTTLLIAIIQSIILAAHGDFVHLSGASAGLLVLLLCNVIYWQLEVHVQATLFILISISLFLFVGWTMDRVKRLNFLSHHRSELRNEILSDKMEQVAELIVFQEYRQEEKEVVDSTLERKDEEGNELKDFRIPFEDLKLKKKIGAGAFGEVILCEYFGTYVVLKRLHRNKINAERIKEFAQEILLMSQLRHPNIVQFIGASWDTYSNIGFVLEYVAGGDLFYAIHDRSIPKSWSDPFHRIAVDAARGISYLHGRNIVHRDLKSMNILVSPTYCAKICDFGLSASLDTLKEHDKQVGTALWTAPEVIESGKYSDKADVFAFGIILIEILTREIPYHDYTNKMSAYNIMLKVASEGLRPTIPTWLPTDLRDLIKLCWHADADTRPPMTTVVEMLNRHEIIEFHADASWGKLRETIAKKAHRNIILSKQLVHTVKSQAKLQASNGEVDTDTIDDKGTLASDGSSEDDDEVLDEW